MNILAIDIGTTSMRGILFDKDGKELASASRLTPLRFPGNYIEQDPLFLKETLTGICREISDKEAVDALVLTAFRSAPALIAEDGTPLTNFIMWQDTRNKDICDALEPLNEKIYDRVGAKVNAVAAASKLTWFRRHMPEAYANAYKCLVVPDYLLHVMTGSWTSDRTYGSRTGMMEIRSCEYDPEMVKLYELDVEKLPSLVDVGTIAGHITEDFAKASGLKAGIPVISSGGDQQNGALGLGGLDTSSLVINCGTGSFIVAQCDEPFLGNQAMICNCSAIPGQYILESNVLASAAALNWMLKELFPELWNNGDVDYAKFNEIISRSAPLANGVICVPLFQGCGSRDWNLGARASFSNICLANTRADMGRAMLEGIAAEIAKSVASLPEKSRRVSRIYIGGGMTKSDVFDQILCDMLGIPLCRYEDAQATAIGAFISASVTLGLYPSYREAFEAARRKDRTFRYEPDMELHEKYKELIRRTEEVYGALNR